MPKGGHGGGGGEVTFHKGSSTGHAEGQLCTYADKKHSYTIVCKPGAASKFKEGKLGFSNVLAQDAVFKNFQKGETYSDADLKAAFGSSNLEDVVRQILEKGELQLSAAEKKEKAAAKTKEVLAHIHKYYVDSKTGLPVAEKRLQEAFDELKIKIDSDAAAAAQESAVVKALAPTIAVAKKEMEGTLSVPSKFVSQAKALVPKHANVKGSELGEEGLTMQISVLPGDFDHLMHELGKICKDNFEFTPAGKPEAHAHAAEDKKGKGKGKEKAAA